MHCLILGAAGMIGTKLTARLVRDGTLGGQEVTHLTLVDVIAPPAPATAISTAISTVTKAVDISAPGTAESLIAARPDVIYHLAAIVSGEAERDFEKGYRINLAATQALFEAIRVAHGTDGYTPRVIFTSSLAVYGAPLPDPIPDDQMRAPLTSYGTQKAITELLLDDYTRRGFMDGIGIRLPTVVIRPGAPNAAASGFFSGILREPLAGNRSTLPVPDDLKHWLASPRSAIGFLIHAARVSSADLGHRRTLNMPGVEVTVSEMIEALGRARGPQAKALIDRVPDPEITRIISSWPRAFAPEAAIALGFTAETTADELIATYLEDDAPKG